MIKVQIILLATLLTITSCINTKFYNISECDISKDIIISKLKAQKVTAKDVAVTLSKRDSSRCGVFSLTIDKWTGIKTNYNVVSIPVLKTEKDIFTNAYFLNGELRQGFDHQLTMKKIDCEIMEFRKEKGSFYDDKTLEEIEINYRRGINVFPVGYLWMTNQPNTN